jgi:hypothetical protein
MSYVTQITPIVPVTQVYDPCFYGMLILTLGRYIPTPDVAHSTKAI